jgi:hypothetical protein
LCSSIWYLIHQFFYFYFCFFRAPIARNYEIESEKCALKSSSTLNHPLLPNKPKEVAPPVVVQSKTSAGSNSPMNKTGAVTKTAVAVGSDPFSDPLSTFSDPLSNKAQIADPLLNSAAEDPLSSSSNGGVKVATVKSPVESRIQNIEISRQTARAIHEENLNTPWYNRKQQILKDYAVSGTVCSLFCMSLHLLHSWLSAELSLLDVCYCLILLSLLLHLPQLLRQRGAQQ